MKSYTRRRIHARDGGRCVVCGASDRLSVHHIRPSSVGGVGMDRNLVTLCRTCHDDLENPIRNLFAQLAGLTIWLVCGPLLVIARLTAPLRWRVAALKPLKPTFTRMEHTS